MANLLQFVAYGAFKVTRSDTENIVDDPNNEKEDVKSVYLKNNTDAAISVKVDFVDGTTETISIAPYFIEPVAVKRVYNTGSDAYATGDLLAYY